MSYGGRFIDWLRSLTAKSTTIDGTEQVHIDSSGLSQKATLKNVVSYTAQDLAQTWNAAGTTFTGLKFNVTDTASGASSLLMDLQVGGTSKFKVYKTGSVSIPGGAFPPASGSGYLANGRKLLEASGNSTAIWNYSQDNYPIIGLLDDNAQFPSTAGLQWGSTTAHGSTPDLRLFRDAANTLAQRNSTNSQTFRLYTSYTDASNYSRLALNGNQIASEKLGTGTLAVTADAPVLNLAQEWNNAGVIFTGLKFNVTDTSSGALSLLMDLQVGGVSRLKLSKSGQFATAGGTASGAVAVAFGPGTASGACSIIVGNGTASGNYSGVFGFSSTASAYNGFVFGDYITADKIGQHSISGCAGKYAAWNTQTSTLHLLAETTDATVTEAFLTGLANARATLPNNATWEVRALIVAKTSAGAKTMAWEWFGVIHKSTTAASTAVLGTPTLTLIADPNTARWSVEFSADTTNGALKLAVTGGASDSIRWAATLHIIQLVFG